MVFDLWHIHKSKKRVSLGVQLPFNVAVVEHHNATLPWLIIALDFPTLNTRLLLSYQLSALFNLRLYWETSKYVPQVPRTSRVNNPDLNTTEITLIALCFNTQQASQIN
jgi:hypothetical protein